LPPCGGWPDAAQPAETARASNQHVEQTVGTETNIDSRETDADPIPTRQRQPHTLISEENKLEGNKKTFFAHIL